MHRQVLQVLVNDKAKDQARDTHEEAGHQERTAADVAKELGLVEVGQDKIGFAATVLLGKGKGGSEETADKKGERAPG
jgi:fructose 1,6-bisphosphatase